MVKIFSFKCNDELLNDNERGVAYWPLGAHAPISNTKNTANECNPSIMILSAIVTFLEMTHTIGQS